MNGSSEHAKQNKPSRKNEEPYEFTHMWDIKLEKFV